MPFEFRELSLPGVQEITPRVFSDERGAFSEVYKASDFAAAGITESFVQVNRSLSRRGVLRGLHYQLSPAAQGKLVRVAAGEVFDVAVDLRREAATFGKWTALTLSAAAGTMVYIPAGFAHGFCALTDDADVEYYCTAEYAPAQERGIIWNDPDVAIDWPVAKPLLADRDAQFPLLAAAEY